MSTIRSPLGEALFPKTRRAVLGLLYGQPDRSFYLREIVEWIGAGMGQVQRELRRLTDAGILRRDARGRQVFFQADDRCPVFDELRGLMTKTVAGVDVLRRDLAALEERILLAFVFGSIARGEESSASDLDLFVVGEVSLQEVVSVLGTVQTEIGREVNPTIYSAEELREKFESGHHFVRAVVESEKVFVSGDEHELGKLLEKSLDTAARDIVSGDRGAPGDRRP